MSKKTLGEKKRSSRSTDASLFWEAPLAQLDARLAGVASDPLQKGLARFPAWRAWKADVRTPAFVLQGISRVFVKICDKDQREDFEELLLRFKLLEDALGRIDAGATFSEKAAKSWKPGAATLGVLHEQCVHAIGQGDAILEEEGWLDASEVGAVTGIVEHLESLKWPKTGKFRSHLLEFLVELCFSLEKRMIAGEFDLSDLEGGVHEIRRRLRWLSIYAASFSGLIQLGPQDEGASDLARYARPDVLGSKHIQLPAPASGALEVVKPIVLPWDLWGALSSVIQDLGAIKDRGQARHALLESGRIASGKRSGPSEAQLRKSLGVTYITDAEATRLSGRVLEPFLKKERVLSRLAAHLDAQR